jgi:polysaccharide chain length determinant protein (PEP-CTERM system associated)
MAETQMPAQNGLSLGDGSGRMHMEPGVSAQRLLWGLWRRKGPVAAVALSAMAIGFGVVAAMPNVYKASATVRVEPARMSPEMVQATVTQLIEDRLKTVRMELFSRPILERVIEDADLYPKLRNEKGMDAAVEEMRRHLDVRVEGENAFELTFEDADPKLAATVANRLPQLFAEETLQVRADQAQAAQDLFGDELARLSSQVSEQEKKIQEFKLAHLGELPEQMEANMRGLERLMALMGEKSEALRDAQRRLAEFSKNRYDADSEAGRLAHRETEVGQAMFTAKSQWTGDHPEVQRLEREMASVHNRRMEAERLAMASDNNRATAYHQVSEIQHEIGVLQEQADAYKQRLDNTPKWSEPLAALDREYESLKAKYTQMLSKKVEADVAHDLEMRARAQMFHVLSEAPVPVAPVRPDRPTGFTLAALIALALGVLFGVALELNDDSLREPAEAHGALRLPVLASVPQMGRNVLTNSKTLRPAVGRPQMDA